MHYIGILFFCLLIESRIGLCRNVIIGIDKDHVFALRRVESGIACQPQPGVFLINHCNAGIAAGIPVAQARTAVARTIVYQNNLDVLQRLMDERLKTPIQMTLHLVYRNNDTDLGKHHTFTF